MDAKMLDDQGNADEQKLMDQSQKNQQKRSPSNRPMKLSQSVIQQPCAWARLYSSSDKAPLHFQLK